MKTSVIIKHTLRIEWFFLRKENFDKHADHTLREGDLVLVKVVRREGTGKNNQSFNKAGFCNNFSFYGQLS